MEGVQGPESPSQVAPGHEWQAHPQVTGDTLHSSSSHQTLLLSSSPPTHTMWTPNPPSPHVPFTTLGSFMYKHTHAYLLWEHLTYPQTQLYHIPYMYFPTFATHPATYSHPQTSPHPPAMSTCPHLQATQSSSMCTLPTHPSTNTHISASPPRMHPHR